eukprot:gene15491-biopygen3241
MRFAPAGWNPELPRHVSREICRQLFPDLLLSRQALDIAEANKMFGDAMQAQIAADSIDKAGACSRDVLRPRQAPEPPEPPQPPEPPHAAHPIEAVQAVQPAQPPEPIQPIHAAGAAGANRANSAALAVAAARWPVVI